MRKEYTTPISRVIWLSGIEGYAEPPELTSGTKFEGGEDDILVREESDTDLWNGESDTNWGNSGGVWDNAW